MSVGVRQKMLLTNSMPAKIGRQGIYWLASYPKSGNTWIRSFITAVLQLSRSESQVKEALDGEPKQLDINKLIRGGTMHSRNSLEKGLGIEMSDFSEEEINSFRRNAYWSISGLAQQNRYVKIHDANNGFGDGGSIACESVSAGILYIVRNPLDVAISSANHSNISLDNAITTLNQSNNYLVNEPDNTFSANTHLRQYISSWANHIESWCEESDVPLMVIRYEDLHRDTLQSFTEIASFLNLSCSSETVRKAIELSNFEQLRELESTTGFVEGVAAEEGFFRKGIVGDWQDRLSTEQIMRIIDPNAEQMQLLGYLDEDGCPTPLICRCKQQ